MTRATTMLTWFALTIIVSLGLYHTSYRVDALSRQLRELNANIEVERSNLHVLKAEWVYLSNPARIEIEARKHLALQPTAPRQVSQMARLAEVLPTRAEAMGTTTVDGTPIASFGSHRAAHAPRATDEESGRVNNRLVIGQTAEAEDLPERSSLTLAEDNFHALAASGTSP